MPTKPLASQPCTCKDSFTLNTIDNEVKELLESCQKLRIKPNFPLKPAYETGLHIKSTYCNTSIDLLMKPMRLSLIVYFTDYGRPERKKPSLHSRKFNPNPKFLGTGEAYFVCHIGPIFQISLIYAFIGCP